jgi:hypothetical protein
VRISSNIIIAIRVWPTRAIVAGPFDISLSVVVAVLLGVLGDVVMMFAVEVPVTFIDRIHPIKAFTRV